MFARLYIFLIQHTVQEFQIRFSLKTRSSSLKKYIYFINWIVTPPTLISVHIQNNATCFSIIICLLSYPSRCLMSFIRQRAIMTSERANNMAFVISHNRTFPSCTHFIYQHSSTLSAPTILGVMHDPFLSRHLINGLTDSGNSQNKLSPSWWMLTKGFGEQEEEERHRKWDFEDIIHLLILILEDLSVSEPRRYSVFDW